MNFLPQWEKITSNEFVLNIIKRGYALEFHSDPPSVSCDKTSKTLREGQGGLTSVNRGNGGSRGIDTSPYSGTGGRLCVASEYNSLWVGFP